MTASRRAACLALAFCSFWGISGYAAEETGTTDAAPAPPVTEGPPEREEPEPRVVPEGVPALLMTPDFTSPAMAFGGYFPVPQIEAGAIRVEPFTVRAGVFVGLGYNDNLTLTRTDKVGSMFTTVAPSVVVGLEGATQRYYALYRGVYGVYASSAGDNFSSHNLGLRALNEWTTRFRTDVSYDFMRGYDPRGSTTTATTSQSVWNTQTVRGTATYGATEAPARLEGTASYTNREYKSNREVTSGGDYEIFDFGGSFSYRVAPKTRASAHYNHAEVTHRFNPVVDSAENRFLVGLTWDALATVTGTARVGYMTKEFDNGTIPRFSAPSYEAAITWTPQTNSSFNLAARRSFGESIEAAANFVVVNAATLTWNHGWTDRVRSTLSYLYAHQSQEGLSRTETYNTFDVNVSYAIHRRLRLGAQYRHDTRDATDPALQSYTRNLTLITLQSAL